MREHALMIKNGTPSTPTRKLLKMIYSPANFSGIWTVSRNRITCSERWIPSLVRTHL